MNKGIRSSFTISATFAVALCLDWPGWLNLGTVIGASLPMWWEMLQEWREAR